MGINTAIEYCDSSSNPWVGCDGCELWNPTWPDEEQHCYAAALVKRWGSKTGWPDSFGDPHFYEHRLLQAIKWSDLTGTERPGKPWLNGLPRIIFLNDLSDSFATNIPLDWLSPYIPLMEASPHIYLILTKKPRRMWQFFTEYGHVPHNFWLGTTVTSRKTSSRIGDLLSLRYVTPRVILWASVEPLLGAVNLQEIYFRGRYINALGGWEYSFKPKWWNPAPKLDWVAAGAESESILGEARPWNPQWAYELRDQCTQTRTKFFWKQNGEWAPWINWLTEETDDVGRPRITPPKYTKWGCIDYNGKFLAETTTWNGREGNPYDNFEYTMIKVGRKASGRLLEGQEWNQMPYYPFRNVTGQ